MIKNLWKKAWQKLKTRVSAWWLLLMLPLLLILPFDQFALDHWQFAESSPQNHIAQVISQKGDFYNASMALFVIFGVIGFALKRPQFHLLALAMLMSCATAGLSSLAVRVLSGRPRPSIHVADGLYGLRWAPIKHPILGLRPRVPDYDYESFPSGHATTAVATAVPALIIMPAVGVPLTIAAIAVMWARFQLSRHRLTDLYAGIVFGGVFGFAFGMAGRQLARDRRL